MDKLYWLLARQSYQGYHVQYWETLIEVEPWTRVEREPFEYNNMREPLKKTQDMKICGRPKTAQKTTATPLPSLLMIMMRGYDYDAQTGI